MSQFVHGFEAAFLLARVVPALFAGLLCGYAVARAHLITSTSIKPALVGCLAALWLVSLQVATWWTPTVADHAALYHSLGGHAAYVVISLAMASAGCGGAAWAQRGRADGSAGTPST